MFPRPTVSRVLLTLTILAFNLPAARGQRLDDGEIAFRDKSRKMQTLRKELFNGATPADAKNKEHLETIDLAAKAVTYPLYWSTQARPKDGEINKIVEDLDKDLNLLNKNKDATKALQPLYCKQVILRAREVAQDEKSKPIATINACRLLSRLTARRMERGFLAGEKEWSEEVQPRLAEGVGDELAAACLALLDDPKCIDGNRYWLFQALADLLAVPRQPTPVVKPETVEKVCAAAAKLVEKKSAFPRATPRHDVEGYKYLRLQAVKTLAQARVPASGKERPALVLARVAGNDEGLVPLPSLGERIEAVIGLGLMGPAAAKANNYHSDYAAAQICLAVVEFGNQASANLDSKPVVRHRPWKVDAARMIEALEVLKADVKTPYVQDAVKQCLAVLGPLEAGRPASGNDLNDWLAGKQPENKAVFRGEASAVKPAAMGEK